MLVKQIGSKREADQIIKYVLAKKNLRIHCLALVEGGIRRDLERKVVEEGGI